MIRREGFRIEKLRKNPRKIHDLIVRANANVVLVNPMGLVDGGHLLLATKPGARLPMMVQIDNAARYLPLSFEQ